LKTSVAHLEYENAQMKRDLAKLRRENHQVEERLVQQEQDNGELTARLDDARNRLRERGIDPVERADAGNDGVRTLPAGQDGRKPRKRPVARIPGQFTPAAPERGPSLDTEEESGTFGPPQDTPGTSNAADSVGLRSDDLDHHSGYDGPLRWAPMAGRATDPTLQVR
jgi:hypothetical protein